MGYWDDFKAEHSLEQALKDAGVDLIGQSGGNQKAKCPFHDDKSPSFSVNLTKGSWKCFSGCGGGGVVEFIARRRGTTPEALIEEYRKSKESDKESERAESAKAPPLDWNACVAEFGILEQSEMATSRGYSLKFVEQLVERKLVGICEGRVSFPLYAGGKVIGTHQKIPGGKWITRGGVGSPWIIGSGHFETVMIFESQWDAFAFMDKVGWFTSGFEAMASIVITRGAQRGKEIRNLFPTTGDIVIWMQNDQANPKGDKPAEIWLVDMLKILRRARVARIPEKYKDLNDWTRDGATQNDLISAAEQAPFERDPNLPKTKPPLDLDAAMRFDPKNDKDCLIGNRYLCRGGSSLWVGGSGIGKSVITLQAAIMFALNEDLFGLEPKRPLKSVIISAEDNFGDISETIQGVAEGMGITTNTTKWKIIKENVVVIQESVATGLEFVGVCHELVLEHKPDFIWINPLLSYLGFNPSDPEKSSEFCSALTRMQEETGVCTNLVHHTGKPSGDSKARESWSIEDFSYIGLGSSVWTNWPRAVLVLQSMKKPPGTFVLRLAKRGQRAGIVNDDFEKVREVYIKHGTKGLRWELSDFCHEDAENTNQGRPSKLSWSKVSEAWDGTAKSHHEMRGLLTKVLGVSDRSAFRAIEQWSGKHIIKNMNDLWIKVDGQ